MDGRYRHPSALRLLTGRLDPVGRRSATRQSVSNEGGRMSAIEIVSVEKPSLAPDNVRGDVGDVTELVASIKSVGLLSPLIVREGDYLVVVGARRLVAAREAGLKEIPVIVKAFTEQERLETMLVENLQREDLSPIEEAAGFGRLIEMGLSQREVASRVGCSQSHVSKRVGLLTLPMSVQMGVTSGEVTAEEAGELAKLKDDPERIEEIVAAKTKQAKQPYVQPALVSQQVKLEQERKAKAKKVQTEVTKLEKAGVPVFVLGMDSNYTVRPPEGMAAVVEQAYRSVEVQVDPKKHAKMACHAVGVKQDASLVELCTDPSKHPNPADKRKKEEADRKKAEAEAKAAWSESVLRRREFASQVIRGKLVADVTIRFAWLALNDMSVSYYAGEDEFEIACELIGIELALDPEQDEFQHDAGDELLRFSLNSVIDRSRALAALAIGKLETSAAANARWGAAERQYVQLLVSLGFEASEVEAAILKEGELDLEPVGAE
jgi:ParB family chromosome partitioning protein